MTLGLNIPVISPTTDEPKPLTLPLDAKPRRLDKTEEPSNPPLNAPFNRLNPTRAVGNMPPSVAYIPPLVNPGTCFPYKISENFEATDAFNPPSRKSVFILFIPILPLDNRPPSII